MGLDSVFEAFAGPGTTDALSLARVEARLFDVDSVPRIGRFILIERVGRGGMGTVYAAFDPQLGRKVAVKILHSGVSGDRLHREAQALARLRHPNIMTVYEVAEHQRQAYIAMEFIEGRSLGALQHSERGSWRRWLALYLIAGRGLAAAHHARLVHRDFKPDNVMVEPGGRVVVADFGLAKDSEETTNADAQDGDESPANLLTRPGTQPGTVRYMAPEQLEGRGCDARSDQYSFCTSLWEAIYGELPLDPNERGESGCWQLLHRTRSGAPRWLQRVLLRGLHPVPETRWPVMEDLLMHLERVPARRRFRIAAMILAAMTLCAVGYLGAWLYQGWGYAESARIQAEASKRRGIEEREQRILDHWFVQSAINEDDPTMRAAILAEVANAETAPRWRDAAFDTLRQPISLAILRGHTDELFAASFSPDGRHVATGSLDRTIRIWNRDGRAKATVLRGHTARVNTIHFSPDGRHLASTSRDHTVRVWDLEHGSHRALAAHTGPTWFAAFSPDGRVLATCAEDGVRLWSRGRGGELTSLAVLSGHTADVFHVEFSPDGRLLASASKDKTVRLWTIAALGAPPRVLQHDDTALRAHFSPDGGQVVVAQENATARLWRTADGQPLFDLPGARGVRDAVFSPDGDHVVTADNDGFAKTWNTTTGQFVQQIPLGRPVRAIASSPVTDVMAAGADDGSLQVWASHDDGRVLKLDGHQGAIGQLGFDRSGRYLVSTSLDGTARVWDIVSIQERSTRVLIPGPRDSLTVGGAGDLAVSVDRLGIDVFSRNTGRIVYHLESPGGRLQSCEKSPDGRHLIALTEDRVTFIRPLSGEGKWTRMAVDVYVHKFVGLTWVLVGDWRGGISLYDRDGAFVARVGEHSREVVWITDEIAGRYVISHGRGGDLIRWDVDDGFRSKILAGETGARFTNISTCADRGLVVAQTTRESSVLMWDAIGGVRLGTIDIGPGFINWMNLDCRHDILMVSRRNGALELWSLHGHRLARREEIYGQRSVTSEDLGHNVVIVMDRRRRTRLLDATTLDDVATVWEPAAFGVISDGALLLASDERGLLRIDLELLFKPIPDVHHELRAQTTACPTLEEWRTLYAPDELDARLAAARCEMRHGRSPMGVLVPGAL